MRNVARKIFLAGLVLALSGCATSDTTVKKIKLSENDRLTVQDVSFSQKTIDVSKQEKVTFNYVLTSKADTVKWSFYNSVNKKVFSKIFQNLSPGNHTFIWNGKDDKGNILENDAYTYVISAVHGTKKYTFNPAVRSGNKHISAEKVYLDKENGEFVYVMPKPAWVKLRMGLNDGALLNTLHDWQLKEAGKHTVIWDGYDKDRLLEFSKDPRRALDVHAYTIPDNSIIVAGSKAMDYNQRFAVMVSGKAPSYPLPINSKVLVKEPRFEISLAKEYPKTADGIPIVSGSVPIKITVHPDDKDIVINSRFELVYFVDTVFLYEDEQGYTPFTYKWDTKGLPEGEHIFTINLLGYNMSVGVKSIKLYVKE